MIAAAIAAGSARDVVLVIRTPLGSTYWDTLRWLLGSFLTLIKPRTFSVKGQRGRGRYVLLYV